MNTVTDKLLYVIQREFLLENKIILYEDLIAKAYLEFPDAFCIDGYPQYPDSNKINKAIYGPLRTKGLIRISNKQIELTDLGLKEIIKETDSAEAIKLTRKEKIEYLRMTKLDGFNLFVKGREMELIDQDFHFFFKINTGTKWQDRVGAIKNVQDYIESLVRKNAFYSTKLLDYSNLLIKKFPEQLIR